MDPQKSTLVGEGWILYLDYLMPKSGSETQEILIGAHSDSEAVGLLFPSQYNQLPPLGMNTLSNS